METSALKYHRFNHTGSGYTVLYEPCVKIYVWLCMYIPVSYRGKTYAKDITKEILLSLPGIHFIDFFPEITTFKKIAKDLRWKYEGESIWFSGCVSYKAIRKRASKGFEKITKYTIKNKCKKLSGFKSLKDQINLIKSIDSYF